MDESTAITRYKEITNCGNGMKKLKLWQSDRFLGLVAVVAIIVYNRATDLIRGLERKASDMGVQATSSAPSDRIAVIAIDDASIANIGLWPWPRDRQARMADLLAAAKATA